MGNLAWVDLETTGLDPADDYILEVGIIITTGPPLYKIIVVEDWVLPFSHRQFETWNIVDVVKEMHEKNGLWKDCSEEYRKFGSRRLDSLGPAVKEFLELNEACNSPMCGATPSFDRSFLRANFPEIEELFHYRSLDVSTLKQYALGWNPGYPWIDREKHRAILDLEDSIANLQAFRRNFPYMPGQEFDKNLPLAY